jgi:hypothetical protein
MNDSGLLYLFTFKKRYIKQLVLILDIKNKDFTVTGKFLGGNKFIPD